LIWCGQAPEQIDPLHGGRIYSLPEWPAIRSSRSALVMVPNSPPTPRLRRASFAHVAGAP
jgi:hypothetical protein